MVEAKEKVPEEVKEERVSDGLEEEIKETNGQHLDEGLPSKEKEKEKQEVFLIFRRKDVNLKNRDRLVLKIKMRAQVKKIKEKEERGME